MPIKVGGLTLWSVEELSQLLKIQPVTIYGLFRSGKLRGKKLARKWYCSEEDFKAYFYQPEEK